MLFASARLDGISILCSFALYAEVSYLQAVLVEDLTVSTDADLLFQGTIGHSNRAEDLLSFLVRAGAR